jgi:hypothetical protein
MSYKFIRLHTNVNNWYLHVHMTNAIYAYMLRLLYFQMSKVTESYSCSRPDTHTHTHTHTGILPRSHSAASWHTHTHTNKHTYTGTVRAELHIFTKLPWYIYIYIYTYIQTHTHTHTNDAYPVSLMRSARPRQQKRCPKKQYPRTESVCMYVYLHTCMQIRT